MTSWISAGILVALLWQTTKRMGLEGNHEQHVGMREFTGKQALLGLFRGKQGDWKGLVSLSDNFEQGSPGAMPCCQAITQRNDQGRQVLQRLLPLQWGIIELNFWL